MRTAFAILFCISGLGACTVQETYEGGILSGRTVGLGISHISGCNGKPQSISTTIIGLNLAPEQASLGYFSTDLLCIPQECRAVFFVEDAAEAERIRAMMGNPAEICVQRKP